MKEILFIVVHIIVATSKGGEIRLNQQTYFFSTINLEIFVVKTFT